MKHNLTRVALVLTVVALLGVPLSSPLSLPNGLTQEVSLSNTGYGHIEGIPYVWQEVNGLCYWSSVDMALQYAGIDIDLRQFFAASGIGFSAAYIMIDDIQLFVAGMGFRQQQQIPAIAELLGVDYIAYFDSNSPWIQTVEPLWARAGFDLELVDGSDQAFEKMKDAIDEGYPAILWVDPYWLPAIDYVELRDYLRPQNPASPSSGHAIVVIGYNDTSGEVEVLDPGVGAFGEYHGYPSDGRYHYSMNYSTLDIAWNTLGYGNVVIRSSGEPVESQEQRIGNYLVERLLGNRTSYAPDLEDVFFASFGEQAFRGLSLDTTVDGISTYLDQFDYIDEKISVLQFTGYSHELFMTLQYIAFRGGLESLPSLLPSYDLTRVLELGRNAYPHMAALSANESLTDLGYGLNGSLLSTTYMSISESYATSHDLDSALEENAQGIEALAAHFLAIADAWQAAGEALQSILEESPPVLFMTVGIGVLTTGIFVVLVVVRRRR